MSKIYANLSPCYLTECDIGDGIPSSSSRSLVMLEMQKVVVLMSPFQTFRRSKGDCFSFYLWRFYSSVLIS